MSKIKTTLPLCVFVGILSAVFISTNTVFADNLDYSVNVQPSMTVTIPTTTVNLDIDPSTSTFDSEDVTVTVGTNNPTGYSLSMSSEETDLTLDGGTETISTLDTLEGGYTLDTFTTNRWGYKLPTTNYLPFATNIALDSNDAPVNARTSTVTFAAKADFTKPAGTYKLAINFTAVANPLPAHTIADGGNMQDISSLAEGGCPDTLTTGQAYTLTDSRDGTTYKVAKLADNKCWMLDNLALDLTDSTTMAALTPSNTNADADSLTSLRYGNNRTDETPQYASEGFVTWDSTVNVYNQAKANADYKNTINEDSSLNYGNGSHKYGVYYNYCAASAGSYCYDESTAPADTNANEDICPKGWRMPTGGSNGEYQALYAAYSSDATNFRDALSIPLSGYYSDGSARYQGSSGGFWSSTRYSDYFMYFLGVSSSRVYPQINIFRYRGYSVRCLLR